MAVSTDQLLRKAKSHAQKGEFGPAAQIYKSVLERFPKNKRAVEGLNAIRAKIQSAPRTAGNLPPQHQINTLVTLFNQERFKEVIQHAASLIRAYPNHIAAYDLLGAVYAKIDDPAKSVANYKKAVEIDPNFAEAYNNLAYGLIQLGQLDEAMTNCQKALQIKPDYAQAHNTLGNALKEQGAYKLAQSSYERALHFNPNHAEATLNIGNIQQILGQPHEAIESFEQGLRINPNFAEAHLNLGIALKDTGRLEEAITSYEKALQIKPNYFEAYLNMGTALNKNGNNEAAILNFEKALQIDPNHAELNRNTGAAQLAQGLLDEATASFKKAIEIKPDYTEAYKNYTAVKKFEAEDDYTRKIADLIKSSEISQSDRAHLHFALSKVKMDIGLHEDGFKLLEAGNALRKSEFDYDISFNENQFHNIKKTFSDEAALALDPVFQDTPDFTPIFVLGMPRSGTTLTEQIISSHSSVFGAGELNFLDQSLQNTDWSEFSLTQESIEKIRVEYFSRASGLKTDRRFIVDKMPNNFRWIGFIAKAFPEAKIVHLNRSPEAVCWSLLSLDFSADGMAFCFDMEDVARYHNLYKDIMKFWHTLLPGRIYDLDYENLTENQLEETQGLFKHLGLDWEDAALDFHKNTRSVATASNVQVRSEMYKGSSQKWRQYEAFLGPMLGILNNAQDSQNSA